MSENKAFRHAAAMGSLLGLSAPIIAMLIANNSAGNTIAACLWPTSVLLVFLGYGHWSVVAVAIVIALSVAMNAVGFGLAAIIVAFGYNSLLGEDEIRASVRKRNQDT